MTVAGEAAALDSTLLQRAFAYWCDRRNGRAMPSREAIDPHGMRDFLRNVYLLDVLGPSQYRYRLIGGTIVDKLRSNATGKMVDAVLFGAHAHTVLQMYDHVAHSKAPVVNRARVFWTEAEWLTYTSLIMPLSADGTTVDMMLGAMDFHVSPRGVGQPKKRDAPMEWHPFPVPSA